MAKATCRKKTQKDLRARKWSASVTRDSDALDLERKVFAKKTRVRLPVHSSDLRSEATAASRRPFAPPCRC